MTEQATCTSPRGAGSRADQEDAPSAASPEPGRGPAPVRIALVLNDDFSMWHFHRGLIRALKERGADVTVIVPDGPYVEKLRSLGAHHIPITIHRFVSPILDVKLFVSLYRIFRKHRFDIVQTITVKPNVYGTLAARLAGIRFVVGLICGLGYPFGSGGGIAQKLARFVASILYRSSNALVRKVWFENPDDRDTFVRLGLIRPEKAVVIRGGGVDVHEYAPGSVPPDRVAEIRAELGCGPEHRIVLMVVARTIWSKGIREFVDASRALSSRSSLARFVLAGALDPKSPDAVPATYLADSRSPSFQWVGFRSAIKELVAAADVVVLPSYYPEGVPTSLLEALAMGKPVVTCDSPGCREVVARGVNGELVPVRDSRALASAIDEVIRDKNRMEEFGRRSREKAVREFSDEVVISKVFRELYEWSDSGPREEAEGSVGMRRRRVALVFNEDFAAWHFRRGLIRAVRDEGHEVHVVTPPGPYVKRLEGLGVRHVSLPLNRFFSPLSDVRFFAGLLKLFRRERFDLIHTLTIKPNIFGALAAWAAGSRNVVALVSGLGYAFSSVGGWKFRLAKGLAPTLYRCAIGIARAVWFQNPDDLNLFVSRGLIHPGKAVLIRSSGVNLAEFSPESVSPSRLEALRAEFGCTNRRVVVMAVSRVIWSKGVREYLEASRRLARSDAKFLLIGPAEEEGPDAVPEALLRAESSPGFQWVGFREDIREIIALADLVVLPSYYREGVPRVLLEAMAMGKPIVTTDNVGCREVIEDGRNGFQVPVRDAAAVTNAVRTLLDDAALRAEFGRRGKAKAESEFSEADVIRRVMRDLYGWTEERTTRSG